MTLRVGFFGTPNVAVTGLAALVGADDIDVVVVVTNPDRARGRRSTPVAPPVKQAASAHDLEVWQPTKPIEIADALQALELDAVGVIAYGAILPERVLTATRHGFVNVHFSLLPRWRGAAPVQHAIRAGDSTTGVTTFKLDAGMDTGPIIRQQAEPIGDRDDAGTLLDRLAHLSTGLFVGSIHALCANEPLQPQDDTAATYAPKLTTQDTWIDFANAASVVVNQIRSVNPTPGARTRFRGRQLKMYNVRVGNDTAPSTVPSGSIIDIHTDCIEIACGVGTVMLQEVQPEGKRRLAAAEFVPGYHPQVGERLGVGDDL